MAKVSGLWRLSPLLWFRLCSELYLLNTGPALQSHPAAINTLTTGTT